MVDAVVHRSRVSDGHATNAIASHALEVAIEGEDRQKEHVAGDVENDDHLLRFKDSLNAVLVKEGYEPNARIYRTCVVPSSDRKKVMSRGKSILQYRVFPHKYLRAYISPLFHGECLSGSNRESGRLEDDLDVKYSHAVAGTSVTNLLKRVIVADPQFSEAFHVTSSLTSERYRAFCADSIPTVFIGTVEELVDLVELACYEMAESFWITRNTFLPPWRRLKSVLSRWLEAGEIGAVWATRNCCGLCDE